MTIDSLTQYINRGIELADSSLEELLSLRAENTTLLALGGPDGNTIDPQGNWWASHPTALSKAIRGSWRWWLRVLLQSKYHAENYQELWKIEDKLGIGSTNNASCYIIKVEDVNISSKPLSSGEIRRLLESIIDNGKFEIIRKNYASFNEKLISYMLTKLRYYVLISTPYRSRKYSNKQELYKFIYRKQPILPGKISLKITLYKRKACKTEIDNQPRKALIYALVIGGIGAATTRGFGKFIIEEGDEAIQIQEKILNNYISEFYNISDRIETTTLPDLSKAIKIKVPLPEARDELDALAKISDVVKKYEWKTLARRNGLTWRPPYREHGDRYHTWVLGLPRSVRYTGYFINIKEPGRWKSPFIFTPIKDDDKWAILTTMFPLEDANILLLDSSRKLWWKGKYIKQVGMLKLLRPRKGGLLDPGRWGAGEAYVAALEWIIELLRQNGGK